MPEQTLTGKVALVTGAARGIGRAIALRLAQGGADVLINYVTSEAAAARLAEEIRALGRRAEVVNADAIHPDGITKLFQAVTEHFGVLDIYVNNAIDVATYGPITRQRLEGWSHTLDGNTNALLLSAQRALPLMKGRRGKILSLSSLGSQHYIPGYASIGVTKAATEALTRYMAVELGRYGINCNTLSGGPIDTDALKLFANYPQMKEACEKLSPAGRIGTPEDLAEVAAFLCSDSANWIYGQTIIADGGLSLLSVG
ncbi:MAG TPA: SDR family oxidoreductase [Terriglobales bacterium]|jgi:3-oxoacyl-[acyl-carrier protein] reductase/7-alpha-hydroxysteroid dehydrogenase